MKNYTLIILDFDGTLCATHDAILYCLSKAYRQVLGETGSAPAPAFADATIRAGLGMENSLKTLSPELSVAKLQQLHEAYEAIYLEEGEQKSTLFAKAEEVLAELHAAGFILTVVSNKAIAAVNAGLKHFALQRYISMVIGDTKMLRKKPDPMAYTDFIKKKFTWVNPQEILMLGDTTSDLLFAQNIGADVCWAAYGYGDAKICRALKPTYTIHHLTEILEILL